MKKEWIAALGLSVPTGPLASDGYHDGACQVCPATLHSGRCHSRCCILSREIAMWYGLVEREEDPGKQFQKHGLLSMETGLS